MNGKKSKRISRREFARRVAMASAVAAVVPAALPADAGEANRGAALFSDTSGAAGAVPDAASLPDPQATGIFAPPASPQQPANTPKLSAEGQAEAEARYQSIVNQYGKRFSEEQKTDLRRLCYVAQPPLDRLRAYSLANGDAAALYLKPLVEHDKNPFEGTRKGKTPNAGKTDNFHAH
jgi:hypothetical protein